MRLEGTVEEFVSLFKYAGAEQKGASPVPLSEAEAERQRVGGILAGLPPMSSTFTGRPVDDSNVPFVAGPPFPKEATLKWSSKKPEKLRVWKLEGDLAVALGVVPVDTDEAEFVRLFRAVMPGRFRLRPIDANDEATGPDSTLTFEAGHPALSTAQKVVSPVPLSESVPPPAFLKDPSREWNDILQMPVPQDQTEPIRVNLPTLSDAERAGAWAMWLDFIEAWAKNFEVPYSPGDPDTEQPDREALIQKLGTGRYVRPLLIMAYELLSLQALIAKALKEKGIEADLGQIDRMAGTMVQISHKGFPDLAGTYDYTERWRREG